MLKLNSSSNSDRFTVRKSAAFTLIEVTLAIVVFALTVVVLTAAFVNTLISLDTIENEATLQADIRFVRNQALQVGDRELFEEGDQVETLSSGSANWFGVVESTGVSDLFRVELVIELTPPDGGDMRRFEQDLFLLRPTWSDPIERSEIIAENTNRMLAERAGKDWL